MQQSIDTIIADLETIIAECIAENNKAGYFAVLYHRVTCRIKEGIEKSEFEDNPRMERLDILFANRYLDAWKAWRSGGKPTASWQAAFTAIEENDHIILQHLLMGINAHINLDLGIAAAETMKGYPMQGVQKDFNSINVILAALVDEVQDNIGKVSPLMFLVDTFCKGYDEMLVCFSIDTAREGSWWFANELSAQSGDAYINCVKERDRRIAQIANDIITPKSSKLLVFLLTVVRWFEWQRPGKVIGKLKYVVKQATDEIVVTDLQPTP